MSRTSDDMILLLQFSPSVNKKEAISCRLQASTDPMQEKSLVGLSNPPKSSTPFLIENHQVTIGIGRGEPG